MNADQIHNIAVAEFQLDPRPRSDGRSYWIPRTPTSNATRILRVSHDHSGAVRDVKLAVSSLAAGQNVFLTRPLTEEKLRDAIAIELSAARG